MLVPTVREIVDGTSYKSSSSVYMHMRRMIRLGKLNQIGERFCLPRDVVVEIINELESEE